LKTGSLRDVAAVAFGENGFREISNSKRAIAAPKRAAAAAVAVASESSRKRKQESAMVPA
jgi:TRAP-type C4-dicarboxylate transport system substrate-binding protein